VFNIGERGVSHPSGRRGASKTSKKAKKKWYAVFSPKPFKEKQVALAVAEKPDSLVGRKLCVVLSELTGNFRDFRTKIWLRIVSVKDGKAWTEYDGQEMMKEQLARIVRRWSSRIDNIEKVVLSDNSTFVVKTVAVSQKRVNTSIKKDLRAFIRKKIAGYAPKKTLYDFVREINTGTFSKKISSGINRIYPVRTIEVRRVERV